MAGRRSVRRMETKSAAARTASGPSRGSHPADVHDTIRVQGARENNLKDVSLELPKRRLTAFTGVSGSGKSSLVFSHDRRRVAADDQRDLQRLRPGLHAVAGPARRRPPRGADDGDHRRPGADGRQPALDRRHRDRRQRHAADPLQPHRDPAHRAADRLRLQRPDPGRERGHEDRPRQPAGDLDRPRGGLPGRHVRALRGDGLGQRLRPHRDLRREQVALRGRAARPRLQHGRVVRPDLQRRRPAHGQADRRSSPSRQLQKLLYGQPEKIKVEGVNLTYEGVLTKVQKSMLSKDLDAMQPHVRRFVERAVTFTTCPDCNGTRLSQGGAVLEDQGQEHRRPVLDADQRPRRVAARPRRAVGRAAAARAAAPARLVRRDRPRLPLARPSGRHALRAERPSAPR